MLALESMRETVAFLYSRETGSSWRPAGGSRLNQGGPSRARCRSSSAFRRTPALPARLDALVNDWIESWHAKPAPMLNVFAVANRFLVIDTRPGSKDGVDLVDAETAGILLNGAASYNPVVARLLDKARLIEADGRYLAIACAAPDLSAWAQPVGVRSTYREPAPVDALPAV